MSAKQIGFAVVATLLAASTFAAQPSTSDLAAEVGSGKATVAALKP